MTTLGKLRWGDTLDEDDVLPPPHVTQNGNQKTVVEYYRNDKGETLKKTTKLKVVNVERKVYKITQERRRNIKPFGAAAFESPQDSVTVQNNEDIPFDRVRQLKATQQEKKQANMDLQTAMQMGADKQQISGSIKDMLYKKRMERELLRAKGLLQAAERPPGEEESQPPRPSALPAAPAKGSYVPPNLRNRGAGERMEDTGGRERRRDENSLRVTNLSDSATEADLMELFRPFGHVSRVFVAMDRVTGENRGFAFVNFMHREDAERAMRNLEGFGYDNLILHVEWAAPRER